MKPPVWGSRTYLQPCWRLDASCSALRTISLFTASFSCSHCFHTLGSLAAFIPCALDLKSLNPILNLISYKHYGLLNPPKIATLKPSSPKLKLQSHDNCEAEAPPVPPRMLALDNLDVSRLGFGFPTTRTPLKTTPET